MPAGQNWLRCSTASPAMCWICSEGWIFGNCWQVVSGDVMKIILSPAKKMKVDTDSLEPAGLPAFIDQAGDKLVTKGTYAKMARGDMVRFLAEENIEEPGELRRYHRLGYVFREGLSTEREYVFERVKTDG
ncbi:MAG: peroxide stress protein YaaA [Lachnospiraceae bacterium]|nr:peroxide stress protein YaaA [Lachnospiraceae bacterium]